MDSVAKPHRTEKRMKQSWTIARLAGIEIRVHVTFFLLLAWYGLISWADTRTFEGLASGVALIIVVFGCVVLHELGHATAARRYGIRTRDITLLPIGGVARLQGMPEKPSQEIVIALAGPAVNLVIAMILTLMIGDQVVDLSLLSGDEKEIPFAVSVLAVNLMLAIFNLTPAFPMDGGRVLRAALALRFGQLRATRMAARVGRGFAVLFAVLGLLYNPMLMLIALFIWIGAAMEAADVELRAALAGMPLRSVLVTDFRTLAPENTLADAVSLTLAGTQKDIPIIDRSRRFIGLLSQAALLRGLSAQGDASTVGEWMRRDVATARADESLEAIWQRLREGDGHLLPVIDSERLIGLIDLDNLLELSRFRAALERHGTAG
jgi:Zn-dependent protease/CBS domain-containing protein